MAECWDGEASGEESSAGCGVCGSTDGREKGTARRCSTEGRACDAEAVVAGRRGLERRIRDGEVRLVGDMSGATAPVGDMSGCIGGVDEMSAVWSAAASELESSMDGRLLPGADPYCVNLFVGEAGG